MSVLRVANASGFYGDRFDAAREMVEGGEIDVLTGDYLAELTLMILQRDRRDDPSLGYAKTFPKQLRGIAASCLERGIKIVVNAGGLNPRGCAEACRAVYAE
ncbi:MAG: acyclic terpene utilization AtuA family protein, partial [Acidobacteriota bacterium]